MQVNLIMRKLRGVFPLPHRNTRYVDLSSEMFPLFNWLFVCACTKTQYVGLDASIVYTDYLQSIDVINLFVRAYVRACVYVRWRLHSNTCLRACVRVCVCACACACVCVCV